MMVSVGSACVSSTGAIASVVDAAPAGMVTVPHQRAVVVPGVAVPPIVKATVWAPPLVPRVNREDAAVQPLLERLRIAGR